LVQEDEFPGLKNVKLSRDETDFIKEYRRLEELEREKGIKFFQCVGDPPITEKYVGYIQEKRAAIKSTKEAEMRARDIARFAPNIDADKVVVDTNLELVDKPKWDAFENNHFAMRRRLVGIFLRASNKLITRMRADKRLRKIKTKLKAQNIRNRADAKRMVVEDWKNAQNILLTDDDAEDNIDNVKFTFCFNEGNIEVAQMKLPLEYEVNIASFKEQVEANPPINFDDLIPFDPVEPLDFEI